MEQDSTMPEPQGKCHVPYQLMTFGACRRLVGASYREFSLNPEVTVAALMAGFNFIGVKHEDRQLSPWVDLCVEASAFGQRVIYPEDNTPYPDYSDPLIKDVSDYRKLKRIDIDKAERMQKMLKMIRILVEKEGLFVSGFCLGPLALLSLLRGAEYLFRDCVNYPLEVKAAVETITETLNEYIEAQCEAGAIGVALDTLFASWNGLGREQWEEIEGPFVTELANTARRKGKDVFVHNCGDGPYFDSQIRFMEPSVISFAALPDDCSSRRDLKERYGDQAVLMGYISTALLTWGSPYQVMEECQRQIDDLVPGGMGYVLAPGCEFPPNAPFENALAIRRAAEQSG